MNFDKRVELLTSLKNGNISDFKAWVLKAKKIDILDIIETAQGQGFYKRYEIIYLMRSFLEN